MKWVDFHMHTQASEDCTAPLADMCNAAVEKGLYAIAITDHVEMTGYTAGGYDRTLVTSYTQVGDIRPHYAGKLRIARGIELGQPLYDLPLAEEILRTYAFDYILCSLHKRGDDTDYYFYDYTAHDVLSTMTTYFEEVLALVRWGQFHTLAHITYPFRYIPVQKRPANFHAWQEQLDEILRTMAQKGLALEINTASLRQPGGAAYDELPIFKRFRELGGEFVTLGADAHTPAHVGSHLAQGRALAEAAGFSHLSLFFQGKRESISL